MRQAHALQPAATTAASVRPFPWRPYWALFLLALAQPAFSAQAQTLAPSNSRDLLTGDAAAFARLLESARPAPLSAEEKARILTTLPEEGEVKDLNPAEMQKLASVKQMLRTAGRDTVYEVKVIDVAQAAVALHARAVLLISKPALDLLGAAELQAVAAHEMGHEDVWVKHAPCVENGRLPAPQGARARLRRHRHRHPPSAWDEYGAADGRCRENQPLQPRTVWDGPERERLSHRVTAEAIRTGSR